MNERELTPEEQIIVVQIARNKANTRHQFIAAVKRELGEDAVEAATKFILKTCGDTK